MLAGKIKEILERQHYALVGRHSAVQVCRWTKKSLRNEGACYKEKFYGIQSHGCCQMSPYITCPNSCLHCWRPVELDFGLKLKPEIKNIDEPEKIIEECIKAQRKLLSGFGVMRKLIRKSWKKRKIQHNLLFPL
jgi:tRNA wybutosine-synthesizing protein 1